MPLEQYRRMRNFGSTPEPRGKVARGKPKALRFVVQKHRASHLHYDFRLELDGVLLSWAVPKGPSLVPGEKRLAMHVEDHPLEYREFEGVIPPKQYGSGTVMLWDRGTWIPEGDARADYKRGRLKFALEGKKLRGSWALVRTWGKDGDQRKWLLLKHDDAHAQAADEVPVVEGEPLSVATGRDLDEIAADQDAVWRSKKSVAQNVAGGAIARKAAPRTASRARAAAAASREKRRAAAKSTPVAAGKRVAMPETMSAQLCTLVKHVPQGDEWLHEIKYDGYRMLARVERGRARIFSRNGREWTRELAPIAAALPSLPAKQLWLDGEIVVLRPDGRTSFQELQSALGAAPERLVYTVFDLLYIDGHDLRELPLVERKARLKALMPRKHALLHYGDHFEGPGEEFYAHGCRLELEGVVSKRRESSYSGRRGGDWVKTKCNLRQEFVIGGFSDPGGARTGFGALLLGVYDKGALKYCGRVGTGFDSASLGDIHRRLRKLEVDKPAFADPPRGADARGAHWVKPQLVGEVEFTEWTREHTLRHPSFKGLRLDKRATEVVRERAVEPPSEAPTQDVARKPSRARKAAPARAAARKPARAAVPAPRATSKRASPKPSRGKQVTLSNPDKLLFPEAGVTKADVAAYYRAVASRMLPHVRGRPLTLVRCPAGWAAKCFYQKHVKDGTPDALTRVPVPEGDGNSIYMSADTEEALVGLVQMGVVEIHPWGSRVPRLDRPDRIIFDFDPDEGLGWAQVVDAAQRMRDALGKLGLECFLKTTGGKGLHVVLPIEPKHSWDEVKAFTHAIATSFAKAWPDRFTDKLAKAARGRRIFIDYLRNGEGATAVAPYSVRAKKNAPVATPIDWSELKRDVRFDFFNTRNVPARLAKLARDPWADFESTRQSITRAMLKSVGL